jgi:type II secretory pathway pseudopilin PulG
MLELLVATTVMSIALIAAAKVFPSGYGNVKASGSLTEATAYAQRKMEELRTGAGINFGNLASGTETQGVYTLTWTVTATGTSPTRYATVNLTVGWSGAHAATADLVSVIAE